jgi:hypothetical protein
MQESMETLAKSNGKNPLIWLKYIELLKYLIIGK